MFSSRALKRVAALSGFAGGSLVVCLALFGTGKLTVSSAARQRPPRAAPT